MTLNLNNSNDIICNSFSIIENGVLVTLDQKIASGSTDDINAIINDTTLKKLATFNDYTLSSDINTTLTNYMLTTDINTA